MSQDEQFSDWAKYFGDSENLMPVSSGPVEPSFNFAQGPATNEQLLEWVDHLDYACPDVVQFDYQQVTRLISACLHDLKRVGQWRLPPAFWRVLEENLAKAENLWDFALYGPIEWSREGLKESPIQHESVLTTAKQLHVLFSHWCKKYGESLSGTGDSVWFEVLNESKLSQEQLDRIRFSSDGKQIPFFFWEADYPFVGEQHSYTITIQSPEIAVWFVFFSVHRVYQLFCSLVADVSRGSGKADDSELTRYMFEYWVSIQSAMAVAQYWCDRICSLRETLNENEKVVRLISPTIELDDSNPHPSEDYKSWGTALLFDWFSNSVDSKMTELHLWRATWAALKGEQPSNDREKLKSFYLETHASAEKRIKSEGQREKHLLPVLARQVKNPTKTAVESVVMRLTRRAPQSGSTLIKRAIKSTDLFNRKRAEYLKRVKEISSERSLLAQRAAREI